MSDDAKSSVDGAAEWAKEGMDSAVADGESAIGGLNVDRILSADFSVEDTKDLVGKLEAPQLEGLAKGVLSAFESSQSSVSTLTDEVDGATGAQKTALESQLGEAEAKSDGILEKLRVLIDGIAQKGGDVSELTASLNKLLG
jgi:hypothetical protein